MLVDGNHGSGAQIVGAQSHHTLDKRCHVDTMQPLDPNANDRRRDGVREREQCVKIGIERNDNAAVATRVSDKLLVRGRGHANLACVHGIETPGA
jgi:hypothetical protein